MSIIVSARDAVLASMLATAAVVSAPAIAEEIPAKPDILIVRDWPGPWGDAMAAVGKAFTEKTGIKIQIDNRPDAAIEQLIQAALAQNREPPVDMVYTMETNSYRSSAKSLTQPLTTTDVPNLANMTAGALPASGQWDYVAVAPDIMTIIYRASAFPDGAPDTLALLYDPKFKGRIYANAGADPAIATAALLNGWSVPQDMDKIWAFIEAKMAPMDPVLGFDQELMAGFQRNEVDLGVSFPSNADHLRDADVKIALPKEGVYAANEAFFVPAGLPESRKYWTMQFVNFFLSKEMLTQYCGTLTLPCHAADLPLPPKAVEDPTFPRTEADFSRIFRMPVGVVAENMADWDAKFTAIMN